MHEVDHPAGPHGGRGGGRKPAEIPGHDPPPPVQDLHAGGQETLEDPGETGSQQRVHGQGGPVEGPAEPLEPLFPLEDGEGDAGGGQALELDGAVSGEGLRRAGQQDLRRNSPLLKEARHGHAVSTVVPLVAEDGHPARQAPPRLGEEGLGHRARGVLHEGEGGNPFFLDGDPVRLPDIPGPVKLHGPFSVFPEEPRRLRTRPP
jgi:hypothetical protein